MIEQKWTEAEIRMKIAKRKRSNGWLDGWMVGWLVGWMAEQQRSVSIFGLFAFFFTGEILIKVICNEHTIPNSKREWYTMGMKSASTCVRARAHSLARAKAIEPEWFQETGELYWTYNDQFNAICCVSMCNLLIKQENIEMKWNRYRYFESRIALLLPVIMYRAARALYSLLVTVAQFIGDEYTKAQRCIQHTAVVTTNWESGK